MKIIDLLNKIANGEEVPNEIKYNNYLYYWHSHMPGYFRSIVDSSWVSFEKDIINIFNILNDEVEIIEEDKKIEKLNFNHDWKNGLCISYEYKLVDKVNELIDKVNNMEKNK